MAEPSRPPSLPSTADEVAYAPVSWLAVGSVAVAGLFVFLLLFFGLDAFRGKKALIMPELLLLAAVAVVLSFAARRMIRTSEGTRTGETLTTVAWWTAVVTGIVYGAYWLAIEYAIRRDAREEVQKWVGTVLQGDLAPAFHRTLEPGRRVKIAATDEAKMVAEFRDLLISFKQSDLLRVTQRNLGECEFVPGGLRDWVTRPKTIECTFTGTLKCPEGTFPVHIPLKGTEGLGGPDGGGGRQWQVVPAANGFVQVEKMSLTRYGWFMAAMEAQGASFGKQFVTLTAAGIGAQPYAYHTFMKGGGVSEEWAKIAATILPRTAVVGGPAIVISLTPDYSKYLATEMYKLPGGGEPPAERKAQFLTSWNGYGLTLAGNRLKGSTDTQDLVTLIRDESKKIVKFEVRVPIEIPWPGVETDMSAARGRVLVECTDPAALEMLNQLRETAADPNQPLRTPPDEYRRTMYKWRVVRVESDMYRVTARPDGPGGAGGPGGGGMPNMPGH